MKKNSLSTFKIILPAITVCLLASANAQAPTSFSGELPQVPMSSHNEEDLFSYPVPDSWLVSPVPGLKYKIAVSPDGLSNINFITEPFEGDLQDYIAQGTQTVSQVFGSNASPVQKEDFVTGAGVKGVRLSYTLNHGGPDKTLLHEAFIFQLPKEVLVVTGTAPSTLAEPSKEIFSALAYGLRIK